MCAWIPTEIVRVEEQNFMRFVLEMRIVYNFTTLRSELLVLGLNLIRMRTSRGPDHERMA
jgi:hypothetical protein